jgi:FeS assembly SUF system regulator
MIKLGKLTDYAIAVMGQLSKDEAGSSSAHMLAEKTGLPEPTVAKVLKLLASENLVVSTRGAAGGYKLSKPADQISIAEIITALDGPIEIVACVDGGSSDCKVSGSCPVKGNWDRVNDAIKGALNAVKLTEMVTPACRTHHVIGMRHVE